MSEPPPPQIAWIQLACGLENRSGQPKPKYFRALDSVAPINRPAPRGIESRAASDVVLPSVLSAA